MSPELRVLMLVDTVADSDMLVHELRRAGFEITLRHANTEADYLAALESSLDLILADNALPAFDAIRALQILRTSQLDIPSIVVTESAGELAAIECVSLGAADLFLRDRPLHLRSAIVRALDQRDLRAHARAADVALRQSAAINQAVLDSLSANMAVLNADGVIIAVNQAWERFARENGDQETSHTDIGINYLEVCRRDIGPNGAEARPAAQGIAAVLARELDQFALEYPCHSPREERWFIMRVTPLAGEHTGAVVAHENITARKRFEQALRESEERFRSAYAYAAIGMALVGLDGRWLQANRALCDFTGYTEQELLATTFQAITHPDDLAIDLANIRALMAGEIRSYQMEKRYFHKHGATIWGLLSVSLVRDAEHQPRYFVTQIQDINERKQADATRALLAAIVDASDDAIIGVGLDGTVLSWNTGAARLYGYRADQIIGQPIAILWPPQVQVEVAQLNDRLARGETTAKFETVRIRSDGQLIDVALTISAITDAGGAVGGFSTIARDISARKRADQALHQKTALIQLFQEVAAAANQASSFDQALQMAVDAICTHIGWPVGHVYLPDAADQAALLPTHIWHLDDAQRFAAFRQNTEAVRLAPGIGLPGHVMASRKPAWIADMILDVTTPRTKLIQEIGIQAGFALPVLFGDHVAAVLEFFATAAIEPDAALLEVLHHVSTQLGRVVERTRAEAALRVSEERFRVLFEHSPDAIILIDPHHPGVSWPIIECNDVACAMNGYTRAELIGQSVDILNPVAGSRAERAAYIERLRREGTLQLEVLHRRKDGSLFSVEIVSSLITVAGRELVLGIDRDITEPKQIESALRAAEAQYRALVEQMPAIIYIAALDAQSTTQYVSPQIEAILGFSPAEWLANPGLWLQQAHPDDRARLLETIGRVQASDDTTPTEYRSYTRDGRLVWLRDTERVVCDDAGQPLFLQGITLDITDRKQAEAAVAEREAYFRALIEHSADAIALFDIDGTIRYGSPATPRILGYTMQAFVGRNAFDLIHPDDRAQFVEKLGQIIGLPETTVTVQARVQHADGSWRDLEGMFTNLLADPAVHAIVTNYRDITERKHAEDALRESERQYRTLASNFPNGAVVLFDHDLRFTIADGAGLATLGLTPERLEGHMFWDIYPPESGRVNEPIFRAALAGTPNVREVTIGAITLVIHTLPVRDEHGKIIAGMLMTQDITERKRIEAALIEERALLARRVDERTADLSAANAELVRAMRLKDEFLASMSHELRTPLNAILGFSEALQEHIYGPLSDQQMKTLASIESSGRHLLDLINDILDLAKLGAGMLELTIEPVALKSICQASLLLIKQSAHKKHLTITTTIDPAVVQIHADARRLKQILVNLLTNAVKFTPAGGAIGLDVTGDTAQQIVRFTVWDTGIGIADAQIPKLWQAFVQLDSRLARQYEGTGLGLALVAQMVELHGGSVMATSALGVGSRFTVALPWGVQPLEHSQATPAQPMTAGQPSQPTHADLQLVSQTVDTGAHQLPDQPLLGQSAAQPRVDAAPVILLAEDNQANSTFIADYLTMCGYRVIIARNGNEAIAQVRAIHPALVLMDIQMPVMDGLEAIRRIRAEAALPQMPIIALTALAMPGDREKCLAAGANDYLSKPVNLKGLAASITAYLYPTASAAHSADQSD